MASSLCRMGVQSSAKLQSAGAVCGGSQDPLSRSRSVPRLPQELVYHILDHTASERCNVLRQRNLANCTLVCHAWLHYASKLLLYSIDVDRWDMTSRQWLTLFALLDYARVSPRLRRYVTSVSESLKSLCTVPLEEIQRALPNVRSLAVRGQHRPEHVIAVHPGAAQISTLELTSVRADAFVTCLIHFTSIDHLRLVRPHGYTFGFSRPILQEKKLRVAKVSFEDMGLGARDPFLVLQEVLDPLSVRSVSVLHRDDACAWYHGDAILEALDSFLGQVGRELTSLSLDMSHFRGGDRTIPALRLCPNLESLTLTMPTMPAISPTALDAVCAAVVSDVSVSLRRLRLILTPPIFDAWSNGKTPASLTRALDKCSALESVTFVGACGVQSAKEVLSTHPNDAFGRPVEQGCSRDLMLRLGAIV